MSEQSTIATLLLELDPQGTGEPFAVEFYTVQRSGGIADVSNDGQPQIFAEKTAAENSCFQEARESRQFVRVVHHKLDLGKQSGRTVFSVNGNETQRSRKENP